MSNLVIFDFDGVLFNGQSQRYLLQYLFDRKILGLKTYYIALLWFILNKLGVSVSPNKIRRNCFRRLSGLTHIQYDELFKSFHNLYISKKLNNKAFALLSSHIANNDIVLILSGTVEDIINNSLKDFLLLNKCEVRAVSLNFQNNICSGEILRIIPYEKGKVDALKVFISESELLFDKIIAYADDVSDLFLLKSVDTPILINPSNSLRKVAAKNSWLVYDL